MEDDRYNELVRKRDEAGLTQEEAQELGSLLVQRGAAAPAGPTVPPPPPPPLPVSKRRGGGLMLAGVGLFALGLVVSVVTYSAASSSPSGGTYLVLFGPMVWGAILFFAGLAARFRRVGPVVGGMAGGAIVGFVLSAAIAGLLELPDSTNTPMMLGGLIVGIAGGGGIALAVISRR